MTCYEYMRFTKQASRRGEDKHFYPMFCVLLGSVILSPSHPLGSGIIANEENTRIIEKIISKYKIKGR